MQFILDLFIETIKKRFPTLNISVGAMPLSEGLGIYCSVNSTENDYLARDKGNSYLITCNLKLRDQKTALKMLKDIRKLFVFQKIYSEEYSDTENISHISCNNGGVYVGTEKEFFLYNLDFTVKTYERNIFYSNPSLI